LSIEKVTTSNRNYNYILLYIPDLLYIIQSIAKLYKWSF